VLAAVTVLAGYLQSIQWMYIIVAAAFVFAAMATGALRLSEYRARISAQNKFFFKGVVPAADFVRDKKTGKIKFIEKMQICMILYNGAHFPISYIIDDIGTSFEGMMNSKPERNARGADIAPGQDGWYRDAPIDAKQLQVTKAIFEGHLKFKLRYGYPGNEKHTMERNLQLTFVFDDKSGGFNQVSIGDVVEPTIRTA
jgi:hypothetical protein